MAQFDVHRNPGPDSKHVPYLLDVQSDLLSDVLTRIVVPLARATVHPKAVRLYPEFEVEGVRVIMLTTDLAGVGKSEIGARVSSLAEHRDTIRDALDFAFQGF
jgi:toxin CcdB